MTTSDIIHIVGTVLVVQLGCDYLSRRYIHTGELYQHQVRILERAQSKLARLEANSSDKEKHLKKLGQAKEDVQNAAGEVARRHGSPGVYVSILFVLLYRILATEYAGKVIAVLPFKPYGFVSYVVNRGIDLKSVEIPDGVLPLTGPVTDKTQACGFLFVYILATLSVKFYVTQAIGIPPPKGAEGGLMTVVESHYGKKAMKSLGINPEDLKMD